MAPVESEDLNSTVMGYFIAILSMIALLVVRFMLMSNKKKDMYTRSNNSSSSDTTWRQNERAWRKTYIESINTP
jgi:hypothetical protein